MKGGPILVTGAGGFVCSEVALALHRAGHDVVAVDRAFDAATVARLAPLRRVEGDLGAVLAAGLGSFAAVVHGAAITASPEALGISRAEHIRRNVEMLTGTLAYARSAGAERFLFLSSMGVFEPGDGPSEDRFTEATMPTADCAYCAAKRAGELLTAAAAEDGFATASLRLGNIFGPHEAVRESRQHLCLVSRMLAEARGRGMITVQTPQAVREWSWLPDLAQGIVRFLERFTAEGPSVMHAGSPPVMTDLELAQMIAARMPGTEVRVAAPPHAAVRPPMGSAAPSVFGDLRWTSMSKALDQLILAEAVP